MMTRVWPALLGIVIACGNGDDTPEAAAPAVPDTAPMIADTQFVRDSSGVDLLIITTRQKVEAVKPRRGVADPEAPGAYLVLPARTIQERMQRSRPPWYIIDVRTAREYVDGHVPGAILAPGDRLEENVTDLQVRTDQFVLVYGNTTDDGRAAARLLASFGFPNLVVLQGGFGAWQRSGLTPGTPSP